MRGEYKRTSSQDAYKGKHMHVYRDEIVFPNGKAGIYEYYKKNDIVVVIPIYQNKYVLIEQYRYLPNTRMIEFPMGLIDDKEDAIAAGIRELQEETGLIAQDVKQIGKCMLNKGVTSQVCNFVVANVHSVGESNYDNSESDIDVMYLEAEKVRTMIKNGQIFDAPTILGFMYSTLL